MTEPRRALVSIDLLLTDEELELLVGAGGILPSGAHGTLRGVVMSALRHYGGFLDVKIPAHCFKPYDDPAPRPNRRPKP